MLQNLSKNRHPSILNSSHQLYRFQKPKQHLILKPDSVDINLESQFKEPLPIPARLEKFKTRLLSGKPANSKQSATRLIKGTLQAIENKHFNKRYLNICKRKMSFPRWLDGHERKAAIEKQLTKVAFKGKNRTPEENVWLQKHAIYPNNSDERHNIRAFVKGRPDLAAYTGNGHLIVAGDNGGIAK